MRRKLTKLAWAGIPLLPDGFRGIGPLGNETGPVLNETSASTMFEKIISLSVGVMTVVAAIWFIFGFVTAAIQWLSSGGDKQGIQSAQKKLGHSVVGLFLVVVAYGLIILIGGVLGLDITNPADIIVSQLHP